jgi:hypothetical protein
MTITIVRVTDYLAGVVNARWLRAIDINLRIPVGTETAKIGAVKKGV